MSRFDFLTDEAFRQSLEADYVELERCLDVAAWKAAHVLAGAIIEALLVDFLSGLGTDRKTKGDPLKMGFAELIAGAKSEGLLSDKAADLSTAVKEYRNLIHPGRARRLKEVVDEDGARIAHSLVNVVIKEIVRKQQVEYGYTAERLLTKLERDSSARAIIPHLLQETNDRERERLLVEVVPRRRFELLGADMGSPDVLRSQESLFRAALDGASPSTRQKVAAECIRIVKEETEDRVLAYEDAFVQAHDLGSFNSQQQELLKQHLLARLRERPTTRLLITLKGIGPYLTAEEAQSIAVAVARLVVSQADEPLTGRAERFLADEFPALATEARSSVWDELSRLRGQLESAGATEAARRIQKLNDSLIPF